LRYEGKEVDRRELTEDLIHHAKEFILYSAGDGELSEESQTQSQLNLTCILNGMFWWPWEGLI
jgi:hypothetical protein